MIGTQGSFKPGFKICPHCFIHINDPLIVEGFHKVGFIAIHISEMHEVNKALTAKIPDQSRYIFAHQGKVPLAHCKTIISAGIDGSQPPECVCICHNTRYPPYAVNLWIVGVHCQFYSGLFGFRHHCPDKILQVVPEQLL